MSKYAVWKSWRRVAIVGVLVSAAGACAPAAVAAGENPLDAKQISLNLASRDLVDIVGAVNEQLRLPVCVEQRFPGTREGQPPRFSVSLKDITARKALDIVAETVGSHVWQQSEQPFTVNLVPKDLSRDPNWPLNRKSPGFRVEEASIWEAVSKASHLAGLDGEDRIYSGVLASIAVPGCQKLEDHWLYKFYQKRVTLTVKSGTLREALNQIGAAVGNAWWSYGERQQNGVNKRLVSFYPISPNVLPQPDPLLPQAP